MHYVLATASTYFSLFGLRGLSTYFFSKVSRGHRIPSIKSIKMEKVQHPIFVRVPSSDILTYKQVFVDQEYSFDTSRDPQTIIDAGANIGLASIFFSIRYPEAKIIALEPESSNFSLLKMNVAPYPNIVPVNAALWGENTDINIIDPGLGNSGFMTEDKVEKSRGSQEILHTVQAMSLDYLLSKYGLERVDILKVDIEGAELEVFESSSAWIHRVDSLVVELHERMKPGCSAAYEKISRDFEKKWQSGENHCASRPDGCLS